ncbi:ATP-binding protein [Rhizobium laguerreae]|uniref:ATP-binding protein n=1 Tax=Rhizobium laguerreae TaxID=1076926 RepID=UPI001FE913A7|nr:ATP-binding protein [Rhizobium laguerreae]
MIGPQHVIHLAQAIANRLGPPIPGAVAFLRCLPSEQIDGLVDSEAFQVPGWTINAVVEAPGLRRISADQAVEQREEKADAALLLIDPLRAGAGLDGIYSAGREIVETELFGEALKLARKPFFGRMRVLDDAVWRAERLGRRRRLTPWSKFDFYVSAAKNSGGALARLGLWPIASDRDPSTNELDLSAEMADRLLYVSDTRAIAERVRALKLDNSEDKNGDLERALRLVSGMSPEAAAHHIEEHPDLWLGAINPGFASEELRRIQLSSWRDARGNVLKWSGLTKPQGDEATPTLILDRAAAVKDRAQLTIRWSSDPEELAAGTVDYRVSIIAGEDILAERVVHHRDHRTQQVSITVDDFEDLEGTEKFDAVVEVAAIGQDNVTAVQSEPFTLEFGEMVKQLTSASGQEVRTLVDGAVSVAERAVFDQLVTGAGATERAIEDKKGFLTWKGDASTRGVRVFRPALLRGLETDWVQRGGPIGHWVQVVRADGSPIGPLEFVELEPADESATTERARDASRKLASELGNTGLLGLVIPPGWSAADNYANAWEKALDHGGPALARHGTVEVRAQSGALIGLLVTPLHPLRFAWHAHYDQVVAHARYEQGLTPSEIQKSVAPIDSAFFPFALPGSDGSRGFLFADVIGFHIVAMTVDGEPEPKAATALLAACLGSGTTAVPSMGQASAAAIARELGHYLDCYGGASGERPDLLAVQAWRAGDGLTVARALGQALAAHGLDDDDETNSPLCFTLDLFHAPRSYGAGHFLSTIGQRRRAGGQVLDPRDRWLADTASRPGEVLVPRLRWAKHEEPPIDDSAAWKRLRAAHVSLAFDLFETSLGTVPASAVSDQRPFHAWGLLRTLERRSLPDQSLEWMTYAAAELVGEASPENRTASDRLRRIDRATARATARSLGGSSDDWPVLKTRLSAEDRRKVDRMHEQSDWVVTLDRNAALDYFDSPQDSPDAYERFVIDTVPERSDLTAVQLVTSTTNVDAIRDLVDEALGDMGLSSSERNSRFLVSQLKALSGRLAIRLADGGTRTGELIALALMYAHCVAGGDQKGPWLNVAQGFLIPVDEIADHAPIVQMAATDGETARRADFIHVSAPTRGPLEFRFVEVKHRRHLRTARQPDMLAHMVKQTSELRERWMNWFFGDSLQPLDRVVRRAQLAKLLRFYVDRAGRHRLTPQAWARLSAEIDQMVLKEAYLPGAVADPDLGYIFCPEHRSGQVERIYAERSETGLWLFGPTMLPDEMTGSAGIMLLPSVPWGSGEERAAEEVPTAGEQATDGSPIPYADSPSVAALSDNASGAVGVVDPPPESKHAERSSDLDALPQGGVKRSPDEESERAVGLDVVPDPVDVRLGESLTQFPIDWSVSIRSNPHLMMVGLPGMGKTTALINIAKQLTAAGIAPVIFSYHDDIDEKLAEAIGPMRTIDFDGLGFNPLRVDAPGPMAYIDVAGTLRDIFASIFPDLGEIQLEELRGAIKQSYDDLGWNDRGEKCPEPPRFRTFLDILKSRPKPNQNLLARLQELADYGFFDGGDGAAGILVDRKPTLIRVHLSTNEIVQRAFSAFVLYSIYKDMFRRGVQRGMTHAIIFDEAHRAAKLKLIPRFAKECRKYGLALALASQGVRDFDGGLFEAVANYLVLRVTEADARALARNTGPTADQQRTTDRLKALEPYHAMFFSAETTKPSLLRLRAD